MHAARAAAPAAHRGAAASPRCCWRAGSRRCRATCGRPAPRSTPRSPSPGDDPRSPTSPAGTRASCCFQEGRPAEALADLAALPRRLRRPRRHLARGRAACCSSAFAHLALGDTAAGRAACEEAIRLIEPLGDAWGLLHAEGLLGGIARAEHRFADAARHHAHAAESAAGLGFGGAAALHRPTSAGPSTTPATPPRPATLRRAIAGAEREGDLRLLAETRVTLAEVLLAAGDRAAAHDLLVAADRWYAESGAGDGAALASGLLATMRAEDSDADTEGAAQTIASAALRVGGERAQALALDARTHQVFTTEMSSTTTG